MSTPIGEVSLTKLSKNFLVHFLKKSHAKFKLIKNAKRISQDGETHKLDFLIIDKHTNEEVGVLLKDWNRSISITVVNSFINEIKELGLSSGILIGGRFSDSARTRAEDSAKVNLITRGRMVTWLVQHGIDVEP
ncbi:MAG: restriction endonuclease [Candidatus Korarchaeota archaeon]|nr:restriction endonuclease [Candidatus Korarchaeota archaeon]NIU83607.1 hypothetical protein [Candidatus Thorarchaeota archaeon]NIW14115.1 hypothetical protein [Candidatus Thorarchaeota archaeon]NIW52222.1 hypothetical protein [Candidatus Korarchaeota archaeon]